MLGGKLWPIQWRIGALAIHLSVICDHLGIIGLIVERVFPDPQTAYLLHSWRRTINLPTNVSPKQCKENKLNTINWSTENENLTLISKHKTWAISNKNRKYDVIQHFKELWVVKSYYWCSLCLLSCKTKWKNIKFTKKCLYLKYTSSQSHSYLKCVYG